MIHPDDKAQIGYIALFYGILVFMLYLLLTGCATTRFTNNTKSVYGSGTVVFVLDSRSSSLNWSPACA